MDSTHVTINIRALGGQRQKFTKLTHAEENVQHLTKALRVQNNI